MKLSEIQQLIAEESIIDGTKLDVESINIPYLHSRWYNFFIDELRLLKALEAKKSIMKRDKIQYYLGKAPDEVYSEFPLDHKILKQDLETYMDADSDIIALNARVGDQKMKCETIEAFLKQISQRSFNIKNAIEWRKFQNGV